MLGGLDFEAAIHKLPASLNERTSPAQFHAAIPKMIKEYMGSFFCNRPRQRRILCNWMSDWSMLVPYLHELVSNMPTLDVRHKEELERLLVSLKVVRMLAACHVVLSGLELRVYSSAELPFALWYGSTLFAELSRDTARLQGTRMTKELRIGSSVCVPLLMRLTQFR